MDINVTYCKDEFQFTIREFYLQMLAPAIIDIAIMIFPS